VTCSRYGIATRDRLAERNLSDPAVFAIFGATQAAPDDAEVWPETGVARLACVVTWNDTRRVAILPEAPAFAAWRRGSSGSSGAATGRFWARTGATGRRSSGRGLPADRGGGPRDTVVELESARIELRVAHQQIRFRSFLLNGGM
jgi:hypothetical protein